MASVPSNHEGSLGNGWDAQSGLIRELRRYLVSDQVLTGLSDRTAYSYDATYLRGVPDVVVFAKSVEDVIHVVRVAAEHGAPIFTRGTGTGLAGGSIPGGGIALVMTKMNRILEIDAVNLQAVVEPGVITDDLKRATEAHGLWYPPDPGSGRVSTIGGNIATNAGGSRGFTFGTTGDYVLGLKVVLADGRLLETGGRTRKFVTGYDLTSLMVGSEGTLGIIVEARLRLLPKPRGGVTLRAGFPDVRTMGDAISRFSASPARPATIEFIDRKCLEIVRGYEGIEIPDYPGGLLLCEIMGHPVDAKERGEALLEIVQELGGHGEIATGASERALWRVREALSPAVARIKPTKISEDATVPIGEIAGFLEDLTEIRERHRIDLVVFGHAGDGNLHPNIVCDRRDADEMNRVQAAIDEIFSAALKRGGTLTGEHGVGSLKLPYLEAALGPVSLDVHRRLKAQFDSQNLLNPGRGIL